MDLEPHGDIRAVLTRKKILHCWSKDGWQRSAVARLCLRGVFSHVVAYTRQRSVLFGTADWLTLPPTASVGCCAPSPWCQGRQAHGLGDSRPPLWAGPPNLALSMVGGSSQPGPPARPKLEAAVEIVM